MQQQQLTVWEYQAKLQSSTNEELNQLGPFRLTLPNEVHRYDRCTNYYGCLSFAANKDWPSFTCLNCRKTSEGEFE